MNELRITIAGKVWRLVLADGLHEQYGVYGDCDEPRSKRKAIRLDAGLKDYELLDTLLHEMTHARFADLKEEVVAQWGTDAARAVWELFEVRRKVNETDAGNQ